jgi:hypothetical protein
VDFPLEGNPIRAARSTEPAYRKIRLRLAATADKAILHLTVSASPPSPEGESGHVGAQVIWTSIGLRKSDGMANIQRGRNKGETKT